jgi:hypothetical protein
MDVTARQSSEQECSKRIVVLPMIARSRASHASVVSGPGVACASPLWPSLLVPPLVGAVLLAGAAGVVAEPVQVHAQPDQVI